MTVPSDNEALMKPQSEMGHAVPLNGHAPNGIAVSRQVTTYHQGPLPTPEDMARYNEIIPNGADRIMKMAEAQSAHRIEIERLVITRQQNQSDRGQMFGLIIGIIGILTGALLSYGGHDWVGGIIGGTTVVSLVGAFITGKWQQKKSLEKKATTVAPSPEDTQKNR